MLCWTLKILKRDSLISKNRVNALTYYGVAGKAFSAFTGHMTYTNGHMTRAVCLDRRGD